MPTFRVEVRRTRKVYERGYIEIEAKTEAAALDEANDCDDPPMEEIETSIEDWDCSIANPAS